MSDPNWDKSSQAPRRASDLDDLPDRIPVRIINNDATGIVEMRNEGNERNAAEWFTLSGRKLDKQPTQKGIYIHNGKKIVVK